MASTLYEICRELYAFGMQYNLSCDDQVYFADPEGVQGRIFLPGRGDKGTYAIDVRAMIPGHKKGLGRGLLWVNRDGCGYYSERIDPKNKVEEPIPAEFETFVRRSSPLPGIGKMYGILNARREIVTLVFAEDYKGDVSVLVYYLQGQPTSDIFSQVNRGAILNIAKWQELCKAGKITTCGKLIQRSKQPVWWGPGTASKRDAFILVTGDSWPGGSSGRSRPPYLYQFWRSVQTAPLSLEQALASRQRDLREMNYDA